MVRRWRGDYCEVGVIANWHLYEVIAMLKSPVSWYGAVGVRERESGGAGGEQSAGDYRGASAPACVVSPGGKTLPCFLVRVSVAPIKAS